MRYYDPNDESDVKDALRMGAAQWMLDTLALNPLYRSWGPYEDYMCDSKAGWGAPMFIATWAENTITPNDLNEVISFYFLIRHESVSCAACDESGYFHSASNGRRGQPERA
jgi:hypothetical protein